MATTFLGTSNPIFRGKASIIPRPQFVRKAAPIVQQPSNKVVPLRGAPRHPVALPAGGPVKVRLPIVKAQAFSRHLTAKPRLVAPTAPQRVGNAAAPSNTQQRTVTARKRQIAVRRTPGRVPNGPIKATSISAGSFVFLSPAGRSTITGIVHRPPQPLVPVLAHRAKGGIFG